MSPRAPRHTINAQSSGRQRVASLTRAHTGSHLRTAQMCARAAQVAAKARESAQARLRRGSSARPRVAAVAYIVQALRCARIFLRTVCRRVENAIFGAAELAKPALFAKPAALLPGRLSLLRGRRRGLESGGAKPLGSFCELNATPGGDGATCASCNASCASCALVRLLRTTSCATSPPSSASPPRA